MNYAEAASFLFELRRFALRPGTDATRGLLAHLDDPHEDLPCVQVAGSNGKGSTARMVERTLREAGLDVGLYTSPHLDDVHERITVNGRPIPEAAVTSFVEAVEEYVTEKGATNSSPTFFETLTAMAFREFARQDVDVAVLEVGIGGEKDATSVADPIASAVTTVTLEHTAILGDTVEEIARDKAHVAPAERPLVTGATGDALAAAREVAEDLGEGVVTVGDSSDADVGDPGDTDSGGADGGDSGYGGPHVAVTYEGRDGLEGTATIEGLAAVGAGESTIDGGAGSGGAGSGDSLDVRLALLGAHQATNAGIAATLCRQVAAAGAVEDLAPADLDDETIRRGLRGAHWPGRFEVLGDDPLLILDGAHNPGGIERLAETLAEFDYDALHVVAGAMVDKDHAAMARALPDPSHVVACQPHVDRAETEEVLARAYERETDATVETRHDVDGALDIALDAASEDDCVLVTGSLYAVAEARRRWTRPLVPKDVDLIPESKAALEAAHVSDPGVWRMRGKGVHRVVRTRLQGRQAQYLKEELLSLGGECAISGVNAGSQEPVDVVSMATMAQYRRLLEKLDGQPYGLASFADELRDALGIQVESAERGFPWEDGTAVMGILNVTPDSFHDGGEYNSVAAAVERAERMVDVGVEILDVGGESTRPGADVIPVEEEIDRVVPVIEELADMDAMVSIDTRKADVARAALEAGADMLNDVSGLDDPEMRHLAAEYDVPVVVMHSIDAPVDPDADIEYDDVVQDAIDDLSERVLLAEKAGLDREQILVDPGIGFGKTASESFELLGRIGEFHALGCPVLVGHSHKSFFKLIGEEAGSAPAATVAGTALAAERGADVIRVHDPIENVAAVNVVEAADDPESFEE